MKVQYLLKAEKSKGGEKMRYWMRFLILACFISMAISSQAFAEQSTKDCPKKYMHGKMHSGKTDKMFFHKVMLIKSKAKEIGLSDAQLDKIMTLKINTKKSLIKHDADIETLALDIKVEFKKDKINTKAVNSLIDKKYSVKAQKAKDLVAACAGIKKILTKEQKDKLKTMCSVSKGTMKKSGHTGMEKKHMW
jgi:Spy/CpxP family protein refolding chaperone